MGSPRLITVTSQREIKFRNATVKYAYFDTQKKESFNLSEFCFCIRNRVKDSLNFCTFQECSISYILINVLYKVGNFVTLRLFIFVDIGECTNKHQKCKFWAKRSQCVANKEWMWKNCCRSCRSNYCFYFFIWLDVFLPS